ncbi:MAG: hypothetical protein OEV00_04245 [Acidobacteriota bacterium]|nr:hypothetical protein [Acidobacteriota bacterium]MDH3784523.1 hypothetical protein [Acidobacteriota bacterium]
MNGLWLRQINGMLSFELKKNLLSARAIPIYALSLLPVAIVTLAIAVAAATGGDFDGVDSFSEWFAGLFQFHLHFVVFFGCVWLFMNLFRGEILDCSLHYYFLCPIRREVLMAGKFIAGWLSAVVLFSISAIYCYVALYMFMGNSPLHLDHLFAYIGIIMLATLGYGAVFVVAGMFLRNPIIPALVIFFWEGINVFLPAALKKISIVFYLQGLYPVVMTEGPFAILVDPPPIWMTVPGLLLLTAVILLIAGRRIRRMEISYAQD